MFKYIILITFQSFTQYYENKKMYYILLIELVIFFIFVCALDKKCEGEVLPGALIAPGSPSTDLQCVFLSKKKDQIFLYKLPYTICPFFFLWRSPMSPM
jgi:hypothetical protein